MSVVYAQSVINSRLNAVVNAIDGGGASGFLVLQTAGGVTVVSITLANPAGTVANGILTFTATLTALCAIAGRVTKAIVTDSNNNTIISGLTVGTSGADIIISPQTSLVANELVSFISGSITGN